MADSVPVIDMPYGVQAGLGAAAVALGTYLFVTGRLEEQYPSFVRRIWERDDRWFVSAWRWLSVKGLPLFAMIIWGIALIVD